MLMKTLLLILSIGLCVTGEFYDEFYKPRRVVVGNDFEMDGMKPFKQITVQPSIKLPTAISDDKYKRYNQIRRPSNPRDDEQAQFWPKKMFLDFNRMVRSGYRNTRRVIGRYVEGVRKMTSDTGAGQTQNPHNYKKNTHYYDRVDAAEENDQGVLADLNPVWGILYQPTN